MSPVARLAGSVIFAFTMGFFEAAAVVYLRRLWMLGEFDPATMSLSNRLVLTEVLRETASLGMIAVVACLAGRRGIDRLAHAALIFGIWDILYYLFLHVLIGWPASPFDWDILFLIPRPWVGPVLAPFLVSAALVTGGLIVVLRESSGRPVAPGALSWAGAIVGGAIVVGSFLAPEVPRSATDSSSGFSWAIFLTGIAIAMAGFAHSLRRPSR